MQRLMWSVNLRSALICFWCMTRWRRKSWLLWYLYLKSWFVVKYTKLGRIMATKIRSIYILFVIGPYFSNVTHTSEGIISVWIQPWIISAKSWKSRDNDTALEGFLAAAMFGSSALIALIKCPTQRWLVYWRKLSTHLDEGGLFW